MKAMWSMAKIQMYSDLLQTNRRTSKDKESVQEYNLLVKLRECLQNEKLVRSLSFTDEEKILLSNYNLLTYKKVVYVANVTEEDYANPEGSKYYNEVKKIADEEGSSVIAISANVEEELSKLSKEEKLEYLEEGMKVKRKGKSSIIHF